MSRDFAGGYLTVPDVPAVDITGQLWSMAMFLLPDIFSGVKISLSKGLSNPNNQFATWVGGSGGWNASVGDASGSDTTFTSAITVGVWSHLAAVKSASTLKLYVNGVEGASVASTRVIQNTAFAFALGSRPDGTSVTDGRMAEPAMWDVDLSPEEILALAKGVLPTFIRLPNLRGYWPLFGLASPEADLGGEAANATISGSVPASAQHPGAGRFAGFAG